MMVTPELVQNLATALRQAAWAAEHGGATPAEVDGWRELANKAELALEIGKVAMNEIEPGSL